MAQHGPQNPGAAGASQSSPTAPPGVPAAANDGGAPVGRVRGLGLSAILALTAIGLALVVNQVFNLGIAGFRPISTGYYYLVIASFMSIAFLAIPMRARDLDRIPITDWLLALITVAVGCYLAANAQNILYRGWDLLAPPLPTAAAAVLVVLALLAVHRAGGLALFVICAFFAVYPLYADYMPGVLWGSQYSPTELVRAHAMGLESIIGIPMRVVSDLLIGFIVFGVALTVTGAGEFFMALAAALMGGTRGGPAKVAILSSGLFGSLSGSVISNVISTGALTIPTMKRCGYPARYAGAVESCASTGGALMPPVMGAVAFVMAMMLNVPYSEVVIAAAVPAILFYAVLLLQADNYAARVKLPPLPADQIPPIARTLKEGWVYLASLGLLIWLLLGVGIESQAPFWASLLLFATALLRPKGRPRSVVLRDLIVGIGRNVGQLVAILAGIGLVVGALSITGVATAFSRELVHYAGDSVILLLLLGALTSFVLGMGMTSTACYIFLAIVLAPSLIAVGLNPMASHLFILYWGMLSFITPPVALAAVAASGIAGSKPLETGLMAMRLGSVLFILPFLFVLNPALILQGSLPEIILSVGTALVAVWMLSSGFERYLYGLGPLRPWQAVAMLAGGLTLLVPEHRTDMIGIAVLAAIYLAGRCWPAGRAAVSR